MSINLRCPACRAENTDAICRRCRADLTLLFALEHERSSKLQQGRLALAGGEVGDAEAAARHAHGLRAGPDSARLLALVACRRRDFGSAIAFYRQART